MKVAKEIPNSSTYSNLAYVGFMKWLEIITISHDQANKMMRISNEFPNSKSTLNIHLPIR